MSVESSYDRLYVRHDFERAGLFALLAKSFHIRSVLYPGSSIHVTPSFYFPDVTYIDLQPQAQRFFAESPALYDLISARKVYRRRMQVRFYAADYNHPIPEIGADYDLLLSLYAPKAVRACLRYLAPRGFLLTCNHFGDVAAARMMPELEPIGQVRFINGNYRLAPIEAGELQRIIQAGRRNYQARLLGEGIPFRDQENYVLFRKI